MQRHQLRANRVRRGSKTTHGDLADVLYVLEEFRNSSSDDEDDLPLLALVEKVGANVHVDTGSSDSDLPFSMLHMANDSVVCHKLYQY